MTNPIYTNLAATAARLMSSDQFGRSLTFSRYTPSVVGSTGVVTKGTATSTSSSSCVVISVGSKTDDPGAFDNRLAELVLARRQLRYLMISASSMTFEPRALDEVSIDSSTWQVLGCTPVNPAGTPLVYGVGVVKL